jgi:hypothetical protein
MVNQITHKMEMNEKNKTTDASLNAVMERLAEKHAKLNLNLNKRA